MSLGTVIRRNCKQKAVYWGNPQNDGQGGYTFDTPVEIDCRWEDMDQIVMDARGAEHTSRAMIYPYQDLNEEGMMYWGTLNELTEDQKANPGSYKNIYLIKRFEKNPILGSATEFLRKAYLTPSLSFGGF